MSGLVSALVAVAAVVYAITTMHTHVFDKDVLKAISENAIKSHNTSEGIVRATIAALQAKYPEHVVPGRYEDLEWLFNNAGSFVSAPDNVLPRAPRIFPVAQVARWEA